MIDQQLKKYKQIREGKGSRTEEMKKKVAVQSVMLDLIKSNLGYEHKFY